MKPKQPLSRSLHGVDVDGPGCGAHAFLSPTHKVHGFHLACVEQRSAGGAVSVTLFPHGQGAGNQTLTVQMAGGGGGGLESAREALFVSQQQSRRKKRAVWFSTAAGVACLLSAPLCRLVGVPGRCSCNVVAYAAAYLVLSSSRCSSTRDGKSSRCSTANMPSTR